MKVSIIVPVYNKEEYLEKCLDSLVCQTYKDIEIILVDDESSDRSGDICDAYAARDNRIFVIHQANTGAAGAWRAGFLISTGRYICFVDSDDWIDTDMIERLVAQATDRDDEMILSDYLIEKSNGLSQAVYQTLQPGIYDRTSIITDVIPRLWGYEDRLICMSRCMKLISRELVKNNEHYSRQGLRFGEDNALTLPCVMDAGRIVVLDHAAMYHYKYVETSVVHKYDDSFMSSIELLHRTTEDMICDKFEDDLKEQLLSICVREFPILLMFAVKNEIRGDRYYADRIKKICGESGYRDLIKNNPIQVSHLSNKIVYMVMKHPNKIMCLGLRMAMKIYR